MVLLMLFITKCFVYESNSSSCPEYTFISQPAQIKDQLATFSKAPWPELEFVGNTTDLPVKVVRYWSSSEVMLESPECGKYFGTSFT